MSGAVLITHLDWTEVRAAFGQLEKAVSDTTPIMRAIGTGLVSSTHDRFDTETDPGGNAWTPLRKEYAAVKKGAGILRESAMSGGLQGSITYKAGSSEVQVGTNKIYGAIHQFGGSIFPKNGPWLVFGVGDKLIHTDRVDIPRRSYLGISADDQVMILDTVEGALDRALRSGASSGGRQRDAKGRFLRSSTLRP